MRLTWMLAAIASIAAVRVHATDEAIVDLGSSVFHQRCVICHGAAGDGQSALAKLLNPPPANLRRSTLSDAERERIVRDGGEKVGRSSNMPSWESELTEQELKAVVRYVGTLHTTEDRS